MGFSKYTRALGKAVASNSLAAMRSLKKSAILGAVGGGALKVLTGEDNPIEVAKGAATGALVGAAFSGSLTAARAIGRTAGAGATKLRSGYAGLKLHNAHKYAQRNVDDLANVVSDAYRSVRDAGGTAEAVAAATEKMRETAKARIASSAERLTDAIRTAATASNPAVRQAAIAQARAVGIDIGTGLGQGAATASEKVGMIGRLSNAAARKVYETAARLRPRSTAWLI